MGANGFAFHFIRHSNCNSKLNINTFPVGGTFPSLWKLQSTSFQIGDVHKVLNYWLVTIFLILSKILADQLIFLEANYLSKIQHSFKSKLSPEMALIQITNNICRNIDNWINLLTLSDLLKAFDSASDILISNYWFTKIYTYWFGSYLTEQT